jgi:TPR repeat protein
MVLARLSSLLLACGIGLVAIGAGGCAVRTRTVYVTRAPAPPPPPPVYRAAPTCHYGNARQCADMCRHGSGTSCNNLGAMYETGRGVPVDTGRAIALYRRACARGAPAGCSNADRIASAP